MVPSSVSDNKSSKLDNPNVDNIKRIIKLESMMTPPTFVQTPFSSFNFKPNTSLSPVVHVLHNLHKAFSSNLDNFLQTLHSSALHNPFFSKLLSFSSHCHDFSQVHLRSYRSLNSFSSHNFAAVLPGDSVAGMVVSNGISNFLNLYNTVLVVRLVLTWFPNTPPQIVSPLSTLCDPYLNIFRGIIPPIGGSLDLSPILAFLVLNAFTSAAAALPAELPSGAGSHKGTFQPGLADLTSTQKRWQKRLQATRSSDSCNPN